MTDRRHKAYLRLDAALRHDHEARALAPAAREPLRELARRLLCVPDDGRELVQRGTAARRAARARSVRTESQATPRTANAAYWGQEDCP